MSTTIIQIRVQEGGVLAGRTVDVDIECEHPYRESTSKLAAEIAERVIGALHKHKTGRHLVSDDPS